MTIGIATYGLSATAGVLSTLSPCVLPLAPILVGSALTAHRWGPAALAGGLALSFTVTGVFIASIGAALGLDQEVFRNIAATLLILFGIVLLSTWLQERFAALASGAGGSGQTLLNRIATDSLPGQFSLGLLLGVAWTPCVGPTLGAAITLASQGQNLSQVALMMALFGLGASAPLMLLGLLSRQAMMQFRDRLLLAGRAGKKFLGILLVTLGLLIASGLDVSLEKMIVQSSPDWLVRLTTSI
jgi:cytochrome c biogenesis protein CcdA